MSLAKLHYWSNVPHALVIHNINSNEIDLKKNQQFIICPQCYVQQIVDIRDVYRDVCYRFLDRKRGITLCIVFIVFEKETTYNWWSHDI